MPIIKDRLGAAASCQFKMPREKLLDDLHILTIQYRLKIDGSQVAALFRKVRLVIEHVRDSSAHTCSKISAAFSEDEYQAFGHVLAAVVTNPLNNRSCTGVAYCESLTSNSVEERLSAGRSVENDVADQNVLFGEEIENFLGGAQRCGHLRALSRRSHWLHLRESS